MAEMRRNQDEKNSSKMVETDGEYAAGDGDGSGRMPVGCRDYAHSVQGGSGKLAAAFYEFVYSG
ncbi:MAG: hypothetical protein NC092_11580 [Butyrivibrio sp.]|nr:hypothetical protein [Muribaculum sp.]MCM1553323.1 hypothetical protein [Butyrivibrio sp.]